MRFQSTGKTCDRRMPWAWRGEYLPAKRDEYNMIRHSLENERFPGKGPIAQLRSFQDLASKSSRRSVRKDCRLTVRRCTTRSTIPRQSSEKLSSASERTPSISTRCEISEIADTITRESKSMEGQDRIVEILGCSSVGDRKRQENDRPV